MAEDLAARARQQAAVASFTLFALQSLDITATIERSVSVATEVLSAPMGALVELLRSGGVAVLCGLGPIEPGSVLPRAAQGCGVGARLSVSVPIEGRPWGLLLVSDPEPRVFSRDEVVFVHAIAAVVAAAVERERVESRQVTLAAFGRFALESRDAGETIGRAVDVVRQLLEAPIGAVIRVSDHPATLKIVQVSGPVGIEAGDEYEVDARLTDALLTPETLIIDDWRTDDRFDTPLMPGSAGSIASLAVAVPVGGRTWGRLVVSDTEPRQFSGPEVDVMSSAANLLAAALQRKRLEWAQAGSALLTAEERMSRQPATEVALLDRAGVIVWVNRAWEDFCRDNGGDPARTGVGRSYLACCEAAGDPIADQVADAVRAAVRGDLPAPMTVLIPCHGARTARWFDLLISSRLDDDGYCLGAAITLSQAWY